MRNTILGSLISAALSLCVLSFAETSYAHGYKGPPRNHENTCTYHIENRGKQYWYIKFYSPSNSADPGGDFNYVQIDPGYTMHVTNAVPNDPQQRTHPYVRIQRYTGPRKSGKATLNISRKWADKEKFWNTDPSKHGDGRPMWYSSDCRRFIHMPSSMITKPRQTYKAPGKKAKGYQKPEYLREETRSESRRGGLPVVCGGAVRFRGPWWDDPGTFVLTDDGSGSGCWYGGK